MIKRYDKDGNPMVAATSLAWAGLTGDPRSNANLEAELEALEAEIALRALDSDLGTHVADTSNPHSVTAAQVGAYTEAATDALLDDKSDVGHSHVIADTSGLQAALDAKQATLTAVGDVPGLTSALAGKSAVGHGHVIADTTGLQAALDSKQPDLTDLDEVPGLTAALAGKSNTGHGHGISDTTGLQSALDAKQPTLVDTDDVPGLTTALAGKSNTGHGHVISDVTGLQTALDAKALAARSIGTTGPLSGGGDLSADRTLSIAQANTSSDGYLSSTDWNTFNGKQAAHSSLAAIAALANAAGVLTNDGSGVLSWAAATGGTWGSITGTLSSQTDLQAQLSARLTIPGTFNTYIPKWSSSSSNFIDSAISDDGTTILALNRYFGIGESSFSPTAALQVRTSAVAQLQLDYSAGINARFRVDASGNLVINFTGTRLSVGNTASAGSNDAMSFGSYSTATGEGAISIGGGASTSAIASIAIGYGASASASGSIAIGSAFASVANTAVMGGATYPINTLQCGKGAVSSTPTLWAARGTGGFGTNIAGGDIAIDAGPGTGTGATGVGRLRATSAAASGTTLQSTYVDQLTWNRTGITKFAMLGGTTNALPRWNGTTFVDSGVTSDGTDLTTAGLLTFTTNGTGVNSTVWFGRASNGASANTPAGGLGYLRVGNTARATWGDAGIGVGFSSAASAPFHGRSTTGAQIIGDYSSGVGFTLQADSGGNFLLTSTGSKMSIGHAVIASIGTQGLGIGYSGGNVGNYSVAVGYGSHTTGSNYGIALGNIAEATTQGAIAIGYDTTASGSGSIALGTLATSTVANQFIVGSDNGSYFIDTLICGRGRTSASAQAWAIRGTGGSGTNIAGSDIHVDAGPGTGTGATGVGRLRATSAAASGTTLQSTYVDQLTWNRTGITKFAMLGGTTNALPRWNGTTFVDSGLSDDGTYASFVRPITFPASAPGLGSTYWVGRFNSATYLNAPVGSKTYFTINNSTIIGHISVGGIGSGIAWSDQAAAPFHGRSTTGAQIIGDYSSGVQYALLCTAAGKLEVTPSGAITQFAGPVRVGASSASTANYATYSAEANGNAIISSQNNVVKIHRIGDTTRAFNFIVAASGGTSSMNLINSTGHLGEIQSNGASRIRFNDVGLAFFGGTPAAQPAAIANATDAASAITQLNLVLAALRTLGLIAT